MRHFIKKHSRDIIFAFVIFLCAIFVGFTLMIADEYSFVLEEQVANRVQLYSAETNAYLSERIGAFEDNAIFAAGKLTGVDDAVQSHRLLMTLKSDPRFEEVKSIRYVKDGVLYDIDGNPIGFGAATAEEGRMIQSEAFGYVKDLVASGASGAAGIHPELLSDHYGPRMNLFACGSPVPENGQIDYLLLYYIEQSLRTIGAKAAQSERLQTAEFITLTEKNGRLIDVIHDANADSETLRVRPMSNVLADVLEKRVTDPAALAAIRFAMESGESAAIRTNIHGETCSIGIVRNSEQNGIYVVSLYKASEVYSVGYTFITIIAATVAILFSIMIGYAIYFIVSHRNMTKMMREFGTVDPQLGCPTQLGFERAALPILEQHKATRFAVVLAEIKYVSYIQETYGQAAADETLHYIRTFLSKILDQGEIYGYLGENTFAMLLHFKEMNFLMSRLRYLHSLIGGSTSAKRYQIRLVFGVYEYDREKDGADLSKMISKAKLALDSDGENGVANHIRFYQEEYHENYLQRADIEVQMERALEQEMFKVFFQPKLNLKTNRPDGCEALVRWYDEEKDHYRSPDTFLPFFEENGFIVKLDKYVYYKVCEFLNFRVEQGLRVYPTSVNVSRLTALAPDFLEYYLSIKKKFRIQDNFIMLEFTESIAHERYETLDHIAKVLHKNGFLCSIDDFGYGYSSFNILKNMEMDEIKLDKIFLEHGLSEERDRRIWESIISLGKSLNLKVTQEGVETREIVDYLRAAGCDVVQGYYYSRPLSAQDYAAFIDLCVEREEREHARYRNDASPAKP